MLINVCNCRLELTLLILCRGPQEEKIVPLVDYFSKWPEAEALPDKSAKSVALFLYKMICR